MPATQCRNVSWELWDQHLPTILIVAWCFTVHETFGSLQRILRQYLISESIFNILPVSQYPISKSISKLNCNLYVHCNRNLLNLKNSNTTYWSPRSIRKLLKTHTKKINSSTACSARRPQKLAKR